MFKKIYALCILSIIANICGAQNRSLGKDTTEHRLRTVYILDFLDKKRTVSTENAYIDPGRVTNRILLGDSCSSQISHFLKVDAIVVEIIVPHTKLLTKNNILDLYKIPLKYRKCAIVVDDELVDFPETILASQNQIEAVTVVKKLKGAQINILLKGYNEIKEEEKKGEIRIR